MNPLATVEEFTLWRGRDWDYSSACRRWSACAKDALFNSIRFHRACRCGSGD